MQRRTGYQQSADLGVTGSRSDCLLAAWAEKIFLSVTLTWRRCGNTGCTGSLCTRRLALMPRGYVAATSTGCLRCSARWHCARCAHLHITAAGPFNCCADPMCGGHHGRAMSCTLSWNRSRSLQRFTRDADRQASRFRSAIQASRQDTHPAWRSSNCPTA